MLVADRLHRRSVPGRFRFATGSALAAAIAAASLLTACFTGEDSPPGPPPPVVLSPCVDVPAGVRAQADSLVAGGNREMVANFDYWFNQSDSWWEAKSRSPQGALDKYDQALRLAPGHCQAVFGKAIASATMITQDTRMDEFIRKVEDASHADDASGDTLATGGTVTEMATIGLPVSYAALFKTSPEKAAPMLVKLSASLDEVDPPTVKEIQELIEASILPRLDTTIAALEVVMDYPTFAVRFENDGDILEIDRGEIGPALAGLKVAKAYLTVVVGYNLELSQGGGYGWARTLGDIDLEDYDHLTPEQTRALDTLTGIFKTSSPYSRMKPAWKTRINGIPELLLSAVGDAQEGLQSAIDEARSGDPQTYDVLRAGDGEDSDIDTVDLRNVIALLERSKKYLQGEVPVEYDRGTSTLKVNFTKLFDIDGVQGLLPYFKFHPYAQWNDTISADTGWGTYLGYEARRELLARSGYAPRLIEGSRDGSWSVYVHDSLVYPAAEFFGPPVLVARNIRAYDYVADPGTGMLQYKTVHLATLTADPSSPCDFEYTRTNLAAEGASGNLILTPDAGQGTFRLAGCREGADTTEFVQWVDAFTRGPIYFTDAAGNKTLSIQEFGDIDSPADLAGKVVFPDPTFGGVLPGQTNATFWETVSKIENSPGSRTRRECTETTDENGFYQWKCTSILPSNPSDLDYLEYFLNWSDDAF